jgi:hypothetical protein
VIEMAQPNMGQRKLYSTRPPEDIGRAFEKETVGTGLSYSQHLADLVADRYGLRRPSERFRTKTGLSAQAALPLGKSVRRRPAVRSPRKLYSTRLPQDVAAAFEAEVAGRGGDFSYSLFLADLLADRYGLPRPSQRLHRAAQSDGQEVLPLDRAS